MDKSSTSMDRVSVKIAADYKVNITLILFLTFN